VQCVDVLVSSIEKKRLLQQCADGAELLERIDWREAYRAKLPDDVQLGDLPQPDFSELDEALRFFPP